MPEAEGEDGPDFLFGGANCPIYMVGSPLPQPPKLPSYICSMDFRPKYCTTNIFEVLHVYLLSVSGENKFVQL